MAKSSVAKIQSCGLKHNMPAFALLPRPKALLQIKQQINEANPIIFGFFIFLCQ
jgi:hypothetical protein